MSILELFWDASFTMTFHKERNVHFFFISYVSTIRQSSASTSEINLHPLVDIHLRPLLDIHLHLLVDMHLHPLVDINLHPLVDSACTANLDKHQQQSISQNTSFIYILTCLYFTRLILAWFSEKTLLLDKACEVKT